MDVRALKEAIRRRVSGLAMAEREEMEDIAAVLKVVAMPAPSETVPVHRLRFLVNLLFPSLSSDRVMAVAVVTAFPESYMSNASVHDGTGKFEKQIHSFVGIRMAEMKNLVSSVAKYIKAPRNQYQERARYCVTLDWSKFPAWHKAAYEKFSLENMRPDTVAREMSMPPAKIKNAIAFHNLQSTS